MIQHVSHIGLRPRRNHRPSPSHEEERLNRVLVDKRLVEQRLAVMTALEDRATEEVYSALERMQQRANALIRTHRALEPYVTAYFEATALSLMQHTSRILDEFLEESVPILSPSESNAGLSPRHLFRSVFPVRTRKEESDGAA